MTKEIILGCVKSEKYAIWDTINVHKSWISLLSKSSRTLS